MKKILSLAFVAAIIGASVGCDDKKSTPPGSKSNASNASNASAASAASTVKP